MPVVSVIIPTFNRAKMVGEAIQSVLSQTFTDCEVIVVDDGSTDETRDVVARISDRVTYLYQPNGGASDARNRGIQAARGRYIAFLDSDDLFFPCKLERQVGLMEENPSVLMSHTSYERANEKGESIEVIDSGTFAGSVYPEIVCRCPIATPTVMVRRIATESLLHFEENVFPGEDIILWTKLARRSRVLGIREPLTTVRMHGGNAALDRNAQIAGLLNIVEYAIRRDPGLTESLRHRLLSRNLATIAMIYAALNDKRKFVSFASSAIRNDPFTASARLTQAVPGLIIRTASGAAYRLFGLTDMGGKPPRIIPSLLRRRARKII